MDKSALSSIRLNGHIIQLEKKNNTIFVSSEFDTTNKVKLESFFQIAAMFLHAFKELEYVQKNYPHTALILKNDIVDNYSITISYDGDCDIRITINNQTVYIDKVNYVFLVNDLYKAINCFVPWSEFNARNYDPAFLNVMLAKELPYIYGEKIEEMFLEDLLVPHVPYQPNCPETVRLDECVRVNSLRGNINIDSFNRRSSNHYKQSNSMRLNSILGMIKSYGYPYNNEYITVYSTSNLIVDGWHRAACLFYLYGNISVPVKIILLKKEKCI